MKACGENIGESVITVKILRSMVSKFNYVVCSIEESNNLETMTIDELQSILLVHQQRMTCREEEENVLHITNEEKRGRGRGRGRNFIRGGGRGRGRGRQCFNKASIECFKCHKLGHFQYECPTWQRNANYVEAKVQEDEAKEEDELLLMAHVFLKQSKEEEWFLDFGCINHMTRNKDWFSEMDESFRHTVKLGNNTKMAVMGKGIVRLHVNGVTNVVSNVYYVPDLKNNLLSIGQLQEKGLTILIEDGKCKVNHPGRGQIMEISMSGNRMFVVAATIMPKYPTCFQVESTNESHLWHCRLGHLHYNGLKTLFSKNMVNGLPSIATPKELCTHCVEGKQHRNFIPKKSAWRASNKLQLIHADLCGPIKPSSISNKRYILSFIDDFSRKTLIYLLHEKSETFSIFKSFKVYVEKEVGVCITCSRTDRGGEFTSNEFGEFCKAQGIKRQLTTAYTP